MNKKAIAVIGAAVVLGIAAISCSSKIMKMANAIDSVPPYMTTLSFEIGAPANGVVYSNSTAEGEVLHYIHCGECKAGVIRPENGQCSYCGTSHAAK